MTLRRFWYPVAALCALASAGCTKAAAPPAGKAPEPASAYVAALALAEKRVAAGDYAGADRILSDVALKSQGMQEGAEVAFWRALYMVDPQNRSASMAEGLRALDLYLGDDRVKWYRAEAQVLKRTGQAVQSLRSSQQNTRIVGRDTVFVTREDEIAALRDQLARANAELERIKKRLANPSR